MLHTQITFTEEEKQEKARAKEALEAYQKRRTEALALEQMDERIKIGLSAYIFTHLRKQEEESFEFMNKLVNLLWQYLENNDETLKTEAAQACIWILESDGFENLPGWDYKTKFHLKLLRKKYAVIVKAVRVLLSQLVEPSREWEHQSIVNFTDFFEDEKPPFPKIDLMLKTILESFDDIQNLQLDYDFFDQVTKTIQNTQEDLRQFLP